MKEICKSKAVLYRVARIFGLKFLINLQPVVYALILIRQPANRVEHDIFEYLHGSAFAS